MIDSFLLGRQLNSARCYQGVMEGSYGYILKVWIEHVSAVFVACIILLTPVQLCAQSLPSSETSVPQNTNSSIKQSAIEDRTQNISERVMSPFCPGRTLSACPSDQARQLRTSIGSWFEQGYSVEAVENRLVMSYGQEVFGVPSSTPVGLVGWYLPAVFVLLMVIGVVVVLRKMRAGQAGEPIDPALVAQAERELTKDSYEQ